MRLGWRQAAATTDSAVGSTQRVNDASVVELRSVEQLRVCPECLAVNGVLDSFCTACGAELVVGNERVENDTEVGATTEELSSETATQVIPAPVVVHPPVPASSFGSPIKRSWKLRTALVASVVLGLAGTGTFAWLWHSEKAQRHRVAVQRDTAQASLTATRMKLARTLASLQATTALAAQRRAVLLRAQTVLGKVDPLLSDADHIKQVASDIQSVRDTFAYDSGQMTADLLVLENFEANPQNYPAVDQYSLVAQVNSELATVRADYDALTASDSSFSDASTTFGNHATAFTQAVRKLQAELQRATSK